MMIEEKAKEFCKRHNYTPSNIGYFAAEYCEQSYIDGAKENGLQWHDLRKNPDDLPSDYRSVWTNNGGAYYDVNDDCWYSSFGHVEGVVAWCEPEFEETEE